MPDAMNLDSRAGAALSPNRKQKDSATPYVDVHDKDARKIVRARYIGCEDGPHCWLVYGVMDTVGAVQISQMRTAGTLFSAHARGVLIGKRKRIEDAIALLLNDDQRRVFMGEA